MTSSTSGATTTSPASCAKAEDVERIAANLAEVRRRIVAAGGDLARVRIVAVTKTFAPEVVRAAAAAGLSDVGENYVDELESKRAELADLALRWHYLGALQSNKIARVALAADVVSGVSRAKEITKLAATRAGAVIDVQVDATGQAGRNGAAPSDVPALVAMARAQGLRLRGLMTVASPEPERAREQFALVASLAKELGVEELSMGMSDDFELAVAQGSTEIRVGRLLFGPRTAPARLA